MSGWVTGHSYIVYGPLANGATTLMFEGVPTYPDAGRFWEVCEKHKVNQFYTAPTAIRALMGQGEEFVEKLRPVRRCKLLGTVGEPINPEAWNWYNDDRRQGTLPDRRHLVADRDRRPPADAAAGRALRPSPARRRSRSSACSRWCSTRRAVRRSTRVRAEGVLCIKDSWPGQMRTVWGDHERFEKTYFRTTRATTSPATAAGATRTATTGSPAASTT